MEVAVGSPPANMDIRVVLDVLLTAVSVTAVVLEKWMEIDIPDAVVSGTEVAGGGPPADIDISGGPGCATDSDICDNSSVRKMDED